jgi:hypothetical protein
MKRAIIVHGWSDSPAGSWFPWLKHKLEDRGFKVDVPEMPDTNIPKIDAWVNKLKETKPDSDTILVGHSIGCQAIMWFLEKTGTKVKGILFIAPWLTLKGLGAEEKIVAKPWLETPINFEKVKSSAKKIIAIFCDDDPYVPISDEKTFKNSLNAETIIETGKGHFSSEDGVTELQEALDSVEKLSR